MTPNDDAPNADAPDAVEDYAYSPKFIHISLRNCKSNCNRKISPNTKKQ